MHTQMYSPVYALPNVFACFIHTQMCMHACVCVCVCVCVYACACVCVCVCKMKNEAAPL